jgi:ribosome assembly protein 4
MGHLLGVGANTHVSQASLLLRMLTDQPSHRNSTAPRLASSSKDGTVRVWSTLTRLSEYTLGGHTASINVVRWGGGGLDGKGVLYTASSDRTVRVWDANGVSKFPALK